MQETFPQPSDSNIDGLVPTLCVETASGHSASAFRQTMAESRTNPGNAIIHTCQFDCAVVPQSAETPDANIYRRKK